MHYSEVGLDRIGTHVIENFFGQIRYSCRDFDSWEHITSSIAHGILRNQILKKYEINLQINHRINIGGIHVYKDNDSNIELDFDLFDFSESISIVLCKMTNVIKKKFDENLDQQYNEIKRDFIVLSN